MLVANRIWLKGPELVALLERHGIRLSDLNEREARAWARWKNGGAANFYAADPLLARVEIHEAEIPDDMWTQKTSSTKRIPKQKKDYALSKLVEGEPVSKIAREIGANYKTVDSWKRRLIKVGDLTG